jgi:PAS domain S-box-containing protein
MDENNNEELEHLKKELSFYKTLLDSSYNWEYMVDESNTCIYMSPSVEQITGYLPEEFYRNGKLLYDIIHPDDYEVFLHHQHNINEDGERELVEFRIVRKDGKVEWISHDCKNVYDDENKLIGIRGSNRLVTDKKVIEGKFNRLSKINKTIVNQAPIGIVSYNHEGNCISANPIVAELIGTTVEQALAQNYHEIDSWKKSGLYAAVRNAIVRGVIGKHELEVNSSFGKQVFLNCTIVPVVDSEQIEFVLLVEDVSERNKSQQELEDRQRITSAILNATDESAFLVDRNVNFVEMNDITASRLGRSKSELLGKCALDLLPADLSKSRKVAIEDVFKTREQAVFTDSRAGYILENRMYPVINSKDEVEFVAIYSKDVTARYEQEEKLRLTNKRLIQTLNGTSSGTFHHDFIGGYIRLDKMGLNILSLKNEICSLGTWINIIHPDYRESVNQKLFAELSEQKQNIGLEYQVVTKDQSLKYIRVESEVNYLNGEPIESYGIIRDITEEKKNIEELRKVKESLSNFFQTNQSGMFFLEFRRPMSLELSLDEKVEWVKKHVYVTECNASFADQYGYNNKEEVIGVSVYDLFVQNDEVLYDIVEGYVSRNYHVQEFESVKRNRKGEKVYQLSNTIPIVKDNHLYGLQGIQVNITRIKQLEEELKESLKAKDKFVSVLSHDLRSPFNAMIGFTEILSDRIKEKDFEELGHYVKMLRRTSVNTFELLENLLVWGRTQQEAVKFKPVECSLNELIENAYYQVQPSATCKNVKLSLSVSEDVTINADKFMVETILRNLLSNAIKFSNEKDEVFLFTGIFEKKVRIRVQDQGVGMDKEKVDQLFEFEHSKSSRGTKGERGSGLGLVLCKEFTDIHKGKILVTSEPGKGSVFTVEMMRD